MVDKEKLERWRKDLSGRDAIKFLNTIVPVGKSGSPEAVELLEHAGEFLPPHFWDLTIDLDYKKVTVREFRDEWLAKLRATLPYAFRRGELEATAPWAFISYSTKDQVRATQLSMALAQGAAHDVFLDHWQLAPGERLRDRLTTSIGKAGSLVLLVSKAALGSAWVKEEIELAQRRAETDSRFRIIPVLLEDVKLPEYLADFVHVDWRVEEDIDLAAQTILDRVRGRLSFSARVNALTKDENCGGNPYNEQHCRAGRALLPLVASARELSIEANQQWLLWELFHFVVPRYICVVRIGKVHGSNGTTFELLDRWFGTGNTIELTDEEIDKGLWSIRIDPMRSRRWLASDLKFIGETGRISFRSSSNPRTDRNPVHPKQPERMRAILDAIKAAMQHYDQPARESFVYDLNLVVGEPGWRSIELVVGGAYSDITLAYSAMLKSMPEQKGEPGVTMELWDPFFGAMKSTQLYRSQLTMLWETEVDLMSNDWEARLGLA